jgi:hypothetical protein
MSVTAFDAAEHVTEANPSAGTRAAATTIDSPRVARSHRLVRRWACWLTAPVGLLAAAAYWRLDRSFVAVGLLLGAMIIIRLVQAWSDYDVARREHAGETRRSPRRRGGRGR